VGFYKKKEKNLNAFEKLIGEFGDVWIWTGFDPRNKVVVGYVAGKRRQSEANKLLKMINDRTDGNIPPFTSDDLKQYKTAILKSYGIKEERNGKEGMRKPRKLKIKPHPDLKYAKVVKTKVKGRVVDVSTKVVFGKLSEVMQAIEKSPVSKHINTSFVERNNLTMRERNRRLTRKTTGSSKRKRFLVVSLNIFLAIYYFVKPHKGLRIRVDQEDRKWIQRTPMMAAKITDHIWTVKELVIYRID